MELWGGHECTVNRVGDRFGDQTRLTGHQDRIEDLARFAELGIKRLRYPVLWERIAPDRPDERDWRWSDERIAEIDRLGMKPIVGLLHHGSGPRYTSLVADDFVPLFAEHAAAVAERYPYVDAWTPVNEPLTTARFSTLYGVWYPHAREERMFWTALLNQIDGTRAAMKAIHQVNPAARLIQTEDLGQYYSTPEVAGTAEHFNQRRWASWDMLAGRFVPGHPLWDYVAAFGLEDRLRAIADDPCPPDIIGVNHYLTSERFLDHRLEAYRLPPPEAGYHDITAARVLNPPPQGLAGMLTQAWERYGLPIAVTESHLGCSREEQLRWLWQSWQTCRALAGEGIDIRALTAWALLGNYDWNSLITVEANHYEPGVFDLRGGSPRPTALAQLLKAFGSGTEVSPERFPALAGQGWWQRDVRLEHAPYACTEPKAAAPAEGEQRPIVITGAGGRLGRALADECDLRGLRYLLTDRAMLPIDDPRRVAEFLEEHRPWALVNAAGWARVDAAEARQDACFQDNSRGPAVLAKACARRGIHYAIVSSHMVFDGDQRRPYLESDAPAPLNIYGHSKMRAEALARSAHGDPLLIRTATFFSPFQPNNFAMAVERALRDGREFRAAEACIISPTFIPDLVRACLDLVVDGEAGIWHLTNEGAVSWLQFGRMIAAALDLDPAAVQPATAGNLGWRARRPDYAALGSTRGLMLPSLEDAVARHAYDRRAALAHG